MLSLASRRRHFVCKRLNVKPGVLAVRPALYRGTSHGHQSGMEPGVGDTGGGLYSGRQQACAEAGIERTDIAEIRCQKLAKIKSARYETTVL